MHHGQALPRVFSIRFVLSSELPWEEAAAHGRNSSALGWRHPLPEQAVFMDVWVWLAFCTEAFFFLFALSPCIGTQIMQDVKKQLRAKLQGWQRNECQDLRTGALGLASCQLTFVPLCFLKTSDLLTWVAHGLRCSCYVDRNVNVRASGKGRYGMKCLG